MLKEGLTQTSSRESKVSTHLQNNSMCWRLYIVYCVSYKCHCEQLNCECNSQFVDYLSTVNYNCIHPNKYYYTYLGNYNIVLTPAISIIIILGRYKSTYCWVLSDYCWQLRTVVYSRAHQECTVYSRRTVYSVLYSVTHDRCIMCSVRTVCWLCMWFYSSTVCEYVSMCSV
jgi:hypothetical protein